jgi:hypothetical protein
MYVPANDNKPTKWHLIVGTQTRHSRNETEAWSQVNAEVCHDYMNFSEDLWRSLGSLGSAKQRASKYGWTCGAAMHYASRYNFSDTQEDTRYIEIIAQHPLRSSHAIPCLFATILADTRAESNGTTRNLHTKRGELRPPATWPWLHPVWPESHSHKISQVSFPVFSSKSKGCNLAESERLWHLNRIE